MDELLIGEVIRHDRGVAVASYKKANGNDAEVRLPGRAPPQIRTQVVLDGFYRTQAGEPAARSWRTATPAEIQAAENKSKSSS